MKPGQRSSRRSERLVLSYLATSILLIPLSFNRSELMSNNTLNGLFRSFFISALLFQKITERIPNTSFFKFLAHGFKLTQVLRYGLKSLAFYERQQFKRRASGLLFAALPLADIVFCHVQVMGKNRLAYLFTFSQSPDFFACKIMDRR